MKKKMFKKISYLLGLFALCGGLSLLCISKKDRSYLVNADDDVISFYNGSGSYTWNNHYTNYSSAVDTLNVNVGLSISSEFVNDSQSTYYGLYKIVTSYNLYISGSYVYNSTTYNLNITDTQPYLREYDVYMNNDFSYEYCVFYFRGTTNVNTNYITLRFICSFFDDANSLTSSYDDYLSCSIHTSNQSFDSYHFNASNGFTSNPILTEGYMTNSSYENSYQFGYSVGYQVGYDTGYDTGLNNGYSQGYNEGIMAGYENGYVSAESYYQNQIELARQEGYANGFAEGREEDQITTSIFSGIAEIGILPLRFFLNILNWEILGINLSPFATMLFTIALTIIILKFILMRS